MDLLDGIVDEKIKKVLVLFLRNPGELFHINKVSDQTGVSLASTYRIMMNLVDAHVLAHKKISKFKIYHLAENEKTEKLRGLL